MTRKACGACGRVVAHRVDGVPYRHFVVKWRHGEPRPRPWCTDRLEYLTRRVLVEEDRLAKAVERRDAARAHRRAAGLCICTPRFPCQFHAVK